MSCESLQAPDEGFCTYVKHNIQMYCSALYRQIHALPGWFDASLRMNNGPTPVNVNGGCSLTRHFGNGGGGGIGKCIPSIRRQMIHLCMTARTKLRPFTIQNLLISVKVSLTPLWNTPSCASAIMRGVRGWFLVLHRIRQVSISKPSSTTPRAIVIQIQF